MKSIPWPTPGLRRASVNSFGIGGSNCHVILDDAYHFMELRGFSGCHNTNIIASTEPPKRGRNEMNAGSHEVDEKQFIPLLLVWSSADERGIQRWGELYNDFFFNLTMRKGTDIHVYLQNLAFTLSYRRTLHSWRSYAIIDQNTNLAKISLVMSKPRLTNSPTPKLGFIFTGQGAQWPRMALDLMIYSAFRKSIKDTELYLRSLGCHWSVLDELSRCDDTTKINLPEYSQPICSAVQIAMVDLFRSFGVFPSVVVGHSSGEIAAALVPGPCV